jgi:hypothetical protein
MRSGLIHGMCDESAANAVPLRPAQQPENSAGPPAPYQGTDAVIDSAIASGDLCAAAKETISKSLRVGQDEAFGPERS